MSLLSCDGIDVSMWAHSVYNSLPIRLERMFQTENGGNSFAEREMGGILCTEW